MMRTKKYTSLRGGISLATLIPAINTCASRAPIGEWHVVRFAENFPDSAIASTLPTQLSWSHMGVIVALKTPQARQFYASGGGGREGGGAGVLCGGDEGNTEIGDGGGSFSTRLPRTT
jgi:hypothetical protein